MTEQKFYSPLKIGLLIVALSYFLFSLHGVFTLSWIGEWSRGSFFSFAIFAEDISGLIGLIFRFLGSLIALVAIIFYFVKKNLSKPTAHKILKVVLVFEAIYWLGLLTTGAVDFQNLFSRGASNRTVISVLDSLMTGALPSLMESLAIPVALFILAYKLGPNKPLKGAIKWGLITGTIYLIVFWLLNTSMWILTIRQKGMSYLTSYPQNLLSFVLTTFGLIALAIFTAYFTKKSSGAETLQELKLKTVGAIITALGMYFLWNYLSWIFFGGDYVWSYWFAWFLGHNMDLWMLSLPLVGLPLLFINRRSKETNSQ